MSEFRPAFLATMKWEDPTLSGQVTVDSGGTTRWGISQKAYPALDIANLTLDDAEDIYRRDYWCELYESINSQNVASKLYDMAVNMGKGRAHQLFCRALQHCGEPVASAMRLTAQHVEAANRVDSVNLLTEMREQCAEFYRGLVEKNSGKYAKYLTGWLRRARS